MEKTKLVPLKLEVSTLSVLIAGLYCTFHEVNSLAISESIYLSVAEKLAEYLQKEMWDFDKITFEEWVKNCLLIYPKIMFSEEEIDELQKSTIYYEVPNGNVILSVSMDLIP